MRPADPQASGLRIPKPPAPSAPEITLDPERLRRIREDTARVSGLLAAIFVEEQETRPDPPPPPSAPAGPEDEGDFDGLDHHHACLLRAVAERVSLSRTEFAALAREEGLLPDGAIEVINDWALDRFDDVLIEDGDTVTVAVRYLNSGEDRHS